MRIVSAAYSRRPSGTMSSPPSWKWTVTDPSSTFASIRQTGGSSSAGRRRRRPPVIGQRRSADRSGRRAPAASPSPPAGGTTGSSSRDWRSPPAMDAEGGGVGRRPEHGPQRRRNRDAEPMARQPAIAGRAQRTRISSTTPGLERLRVGVRASMGQVQHAGAHQRRRPVRGDVGEPDGQHRDRRVDLEVDDDLGHAEDLESLGERFARVRRPGRLVRSQVACQTVRCVAGAPGQRSAACLSSGGGGRRPTPLVRVAGGVE